MKAESRGSFYFQFSFHLYLSDIVAKCLLKDTPNIEQPHVNLVVGWPTGPVNILQHLAAATHPL